MYEETGYRGVPELRLPEVAYTLPGGEPKTVDFWVVRADTDTPPVPVNDPDEVDSVVWLAPPDAVRRLTYPADAELVERVAALPPRTAVTLLVRHAHAGDRKAWSGNDALRPIDERGRREATGLADVLSRFEPGRLVAATPVRCKQTLEPLAERLGLPIVVESAMAEPAEVDEVPAKVKVAAARLAELRDGPTAAICSQGKIMPPLLAMLAGADDPAPYKTPKGGGWVLSWVGEKPVALSRL
jgi:8-oxo-dGTP diphosphatase